MLGILVDMDQKDNYTAKCWPRLASTTFVACSWLVRLVMILFVLSYAVFPTLVGWFTIPGIMVAGEVAALVVDIGGGTFMAGFEGDDASAAFPSIVAGP